MIQKINVVKNYDADGKEIEDLSKVILPLDLSQEILTVILRGTK